MAGLRRDAATRGCTDRRVWRGRPKCLLECSGRVVHVEDGEVVDFSEVDLEVWDEAARVYADGEADAERVAEFVRTVDDEYGVEARFVEDG